MSALAHSRLTEQEYLALDRASDVRNEFYDGSLHAMAGGMPFHALILPNLAGELRQALKKRTCSVYATELRIRISGSTFVYPDISVVCGAPQHSDEKRDTITNPILIVEVLSPSTEAHDRGLKFARYRTLESLREYALVWQDEPRVEIFRRQASGDWLLSEAVGLESSMRFDSVDCAVPLAEIYHQVEFPEAAAEA